MRYRDKSTGRVVVLRPSRTEFLVVTDPGEAESMQPLMVQRLFSITRSTNNDRVFILQARSDAESAVEIDRQLEQLRRDPRVRTVSPGFVDPTTGSTRFALPDRVVVRFRAAGEGEVRGIVARFGARISRRFRGRLYELEAPPGTAPPDLIEQLNALDEVVFAEPSFYGVDDQEIGVRIEVARPPRPETEAEAVAGPAAPLGWNLEKLEAAAAWEQTRGRADVVVAVVDGLPEVDHEALSGKLVAPVDDTLIFSNDRSISSHATNIAGTIAAESSTMVGVAPGVRVLPVAVNLRSQSYVERADAVLAVADLARRKRVGNAAFSRMVMCCSWRTGGDTAVVRTALEEVVAAGVLVVFSAGNEQSSLPHFPSDYGTWEGVLAQGVISVAATDRNDRKASYSNYSPRVTVSAPGGDGLPLDDRDILCPDQGDSYAYAAGTSIAAPHVAALAALMLSVNPGLSVQDLKRLIVETVDDIRGANPGYREWLGAGRVNARRAVAAAVAARPADDEPGRVDDQPAPIDDQPVEEPRPPTDSVAEPPEPADTEPGAEPRRRWFRVTYVMPADVAAVIRQALGEVSARLEERTGWSVLQARVTDRTSEVTIDMSSTETP